MQAEVMVLQFDRGWSIVSTCLVYGTSVGSRQSRITWVYPQLKRGEKIRIVDDQVSTPTNVHNLVQGIVSIIQTGSSGIFHLSGDEILTPYQMAIKTAQFCALESGLIERVNAKIFTQPAARSAITGFNIEKAKSVLGFIPTPFDKALTRIFPPDEVKNPDPAR